MAELYTFFAFFIGVPLFVIAWIWSLVVAKRSSTKWLLVMLFLPVLAVTGFALIHWQKGKGPFLLTLLSVSMLLGTLFIIS